MFDPTHFGGSGGYAHCCGCGVPIFDANRAVRIDFHTDPDGKEGLSGLYHRRCSGPFQAFATVINLGWIAKF